MNPGRTPWSRLVAAARQAPDDRLLSAPVGFATRVAALAAAAEPRFAAVVERLAWRALGVAALVAVVSVATSYPALRVLAGASGEDDLLPDSDAVAIVLDLSSD